jgi:hypothetical protein
MTFSSLDQATALVGVLVGCIFLFDGWRRNPKEALPFHRTPRITGLVWIVSGGAISGFLSLLSEQKDRMEKVQAMTVYVTSFAATLILLLFLSGLALAFYYVAKYRKHGSLWLATAEAIPFTLFFFANGLDVLLERVREMEAQRTDEADPAPAKAGAPRNYDEIGQLRAELAACQIGQKSLLIILTEIAQREGYWKARTASDFVDALRFALKASGEGRTSLTDAYWNAYRFGILRSAEINNMVGDSTIQGSLPYMELAPRGVALLEELRVPVQPQRASAC